MIGGKKANVAQVCFRHKVPLDIDLRLLWLKIKEIYLELHVVVNQQHLILLLHLSLCNVSVILQWFKYFMSVTAASCRAPVCSEGWQGTGCTGGVPDSFCSVLRPCCHEESRSSFTVTTTPGWWAVLAFRLQQQKKIKKSKRYKALRVCLY